MAAPKGHKKYGGRVKGTPNKKTVAVEQIAAKLGFEPFQMLCHIARGDWEALGLQGPGLITLEHQIRAIVEACQYLYPKRKAIEVTEMHDPNADRPLRDLTDEELDNM